MIATPYRGLGADCFCRICLHLRNQFYPFPTRAPEYALARAPIIRASLFDLVQHPALTRKLTEELQMQMARVERRIPREFCGGFQLRSGWGVYLQAGGG